MAPTWAGPGLLYLATNWMLKKPIFLLKYFRYTSIKMFFFSKNLAQSGAHTSGPTVSGSQMNLKARSKLRITKEEFRRKRSRLGQHAIFELLTLNPSKLLFTKEEVEVRNKFIRLIVWEGNH